MTQFTQVFKHPKSLKYETKQKSLGKTVWKFGLRFVKQWPICPQKYIEKVQKLKKKNLKTMKTSTIFGGFWGQRGEWYPLAPPVGAEISKTY